MTCGVAYSYMANTTLVGDAYHYFIQTTPTTSSFRQCFWAGIQVLAFCFYTRSTETPGSLIQALRDDVRVWLTVTCQYNASRWCLPLLHTNNAHYYVIPVMLLSRNPGVSFTLLSNVKRNTWIPDTSTQGWRAGRAYSYMPNTTLVGNAYRYFIQTTLTIPSFR